METINKIQQLILERGYEGNFSDLGEIYTKTTKINGKGLVLFNYTPKAMYKNEWNDFERVCRGIIFDELGSVVARPFLKFFNLNQLGYDKNYILDRGIESITVKLDGSLGIVFYFEGGWRAVTHGSFNSEQATKAEEMLEVYDLSLLNKDFTYMVEIIYPENRIVLDYKGYKGLVMLAAIHTATGEELKRKTLSALCSEMNFRIVDLEHFSWNELLYLVDNIKDVEGWVILINNGERVKLKTEHYKELHKLVSNITPRNVFEAYCAGNVEEYISALPDEFQIECKELVEGFNASYLELKSKYEGIYLSILIEMYEPSRRAYAELANKYKHPQILFALLDGKDISKLIQGIIHDSL